MDERTLARFMSKVEIQPSGCWYWTGHITDDGYGTFHIGRDSELAHRVAYEHFIEVIPDGLELDHLCHTRSPGCPGGKTDLHRRCVNPFTDLEPVTGAENARRRGLVVTECPQGHKYTPENTYWPPNGGKECRECRAERGHQWVAEHNPGVRHGTETHCPSGHAYAGDNLIINCRGARACRECKRKDQRERMRRKRAAAKAAREAA